MKIEVDLSSGAEATPGNVNRQRAGRVLEKVGGRLDGCGFGPGRKMWIFEERFNFPWVDNECDDFHGARTFGTNERVDLVDALNERRPRLRSFFVGDVLENKRIIRRAFSLCP